MMNIKIAHFLITSISCIVAYLWVITLPNVIQSLVARWAGDETPQTFGFSSLNPLQHIDMFGFFMLLVTCGFGSPLGWGRSVYIDPFSITNRWKLFLVSFADVIAHIVLTFMLLIMLEMMFGLPVVGLFHYMVTGRHVSHILLAQAFPQISSIVVVCGFIVFLATYLHILLAILYLILNSRDFYLLCTAEGKMDYAMSRIKPSNFFIPFVLLFVFAEPLRYFVVYIIAYAGWLVGLLLGL